MSMIGTTLFEWHIWLYVRCLNSKIWSNCFQWSIVRFFFFDFLETRALFCLKNTLSTLNDIIVLSCIVLLLLLVHNHLLVLHMYFQLVRDVEQCYVVSNWRGDVDSLLSFLRATRAYCHMFHSCFTFIIFFFIFIFLCVCVLIQTRTTSMQYDRDVPWRQNGHDTFVESHCNNEQYQKQLQCNHVEIDWINDADDYGANDR